MSVWLRDRNLLELLAKTATGATEQPTEPPPPWLRPQRRETVIWSGSGVHLLEARSGPELPTLESAYSGLATDHLLGQFPGPLPEDVRILDKGTAIITTTRVVFAGGRHRREWSYGRIRGLGHVAHTPATFFRLAAPKVFGLLLPEPITVEFRFLLALALADRAKARHLLAQRLDLLLNEHRHARPEAPPVPRKTWRTTAIAGFAAAATVLTLLGFAWWRAGTQPRPTALAGTSVVATPSTPSIPSPTSTATPAPSPATPTLTPEPTPSSCGAPRNPYGYNFCDGELVRDPDPQVCEYFTCIWDFSSGRGYLVQCEDDMVSLWGGISGVCGEHGGVKRPVYQ